MFKTVYLKHLFSVFSKKEQGNPDSSGLPCVLHMQAFF